MSSTIDTSVLDKINNSATTTKAATDEAGSQDRFLKLLVTQMQNQDPMNPMDNAQLTSQIAQINTVSGIAALNTTVEGLSGQFLQMQTMQGAALVGKDVVVEGNQLAIDSSTGIGRGGFSLASAADSVKVEVLSASGQVLDTLNLGAQSSGNHSFEWPAGSNTGNLTFRVSAASGATALSPTALMSDTVNSVTSNGKELVLELQRSGDVAYSKVKALG